MYDDVKHQTIADFNSIPLAGVNIAGTSIAFINFIQQINALRMICNLGLQYHSRYNGVDGNSSLQEKRTWAEVAQDVFSFQLETGSVSCHTCSMSPDLVEAPSSMDEPQARPLFSQCMRFICGECRQTQSAERSGSSTCGHSPPHPLAPVTTGRTSLDEVAVPLADHDHATHELPSKVRALLGQLKAQPADTKWLVVQDFVLLRTRSV